MTPEEALAKALRDPDWGRKNSESMADMEFQMQIAPNLGYRGPIDPSIARYHGVPTSDSLTTHGFQVPEEGSLGKGYRYAEGGEETIIPKEPGTVNAIGRHGDIPTWSHEYRHAQRPDMSEAKNRILDGYNAQNRDQWDSAVDLWQDWMQRRSEDKVSKEKAEKSLIGRVKVHADGRMGEGNREYKEQKAGERSFIPESEVTTRMLLLDLLSLEEDEFEAGRSRSQFWSKRKKEIKRKKEKDSNDS